MNRKSNVRFIKDDRGLGGLASITKADHLTAVPEDPFKGVYDESFVMPPFPLYELVRLKDISTILKQCIEAYKRNISGFGIRPHYLADETADGQDAAKIAEWDEVVEVAKYMNFNRSFEEVFGQAIDDRETTGNGYIEVVRDGTGLPCEIETIDPVTMRVSLVGDLVEVDITTRTRIIKAKRRFRRYMQWVGGIQVFFKEFGDPRTLSSKTGQYVADATTIPDDEVANEIIHLKIGNDAYGIPRWIGHVVHMYGARMAEELNYRYFKQGRHTPMAIILSNAILSEESEDALIDYAKSVEGVDNSHSFLVIETEGLAESDDPLEEKHAPAKVELKSLAEMLQKDALFLEYDTASREKVQSAFRLPDLYVGRSKDFNRATADMARAVTEEQVFEPERKILEFVVNRKLFEPYQLRHVELQFATPDITDLTEVASVLTALNGAKAIAPNDVRDLLGKILGKTLEPFKGDEYDHPVGVVKPTDNANPNGGGMTAAGAVQKMVDIMKNVRDEVQTDDGTHY